MRFRLNRDGEWHTSDENNVFHLYSSSGESAKNMRGQKISIFGLVLSYKEKDGSLILDEQDYKSAKAIFPSLSPDLKGLRLARIETLDKEGLAKRVETPTTPPQRVPCQAKWSNALRMELIDMEGKCLHFTAASRGPFYVLFSAVPRKEGKRYVVEISPSKVTIFKVCLATIKFNNCLISQSVIQHHD